MIIILGLMIIFIFLINFLQYKYSIDLFFISIGIFTAICGIYIVDGQIKEAISSYIAFFGVNLLQWIILFYIFLINQTHIPNFFYLLLIGLTTITITILVQFYKSRFNPVRRRKVSKYKDNSDFILIKNNKQIFIIIFGIIITLGCLISIFYSKFLYASFYVFFGVMMIIYGTYIEFNKKQMSFNYFIVMVILILLQWMFILYLGYYLRLDSGEISIPFFFTFIVSSYFFFQIRESNMKYIGRYRKTKKKQY
jgi:hypothetical protein